MRRPCPPIASSLLVLLVLSAPFTGRAQPNAAAPPPSSMPSSTPAPADPSATAGLAPVVVSALPLSTPPFELPASMDIVGPEAIGQARARVDLSESLGAVPGLLARDRGNHAQDLQLSIRGFGARASFGIRGLRLYVDGIPATMPDGQGQVSHVDLGSADRIEVLRGPFSALFGNASGGVVQVFTEDGSGPPALRFDLAAGSYGLLRMGTRLAGEQGRVGYVASASSFSTDGYRAHSQARRDVANVKLNWAPDEASRFTLVANRMHLPMARDPLGLTRAQFEADPRGADPAAFTFDPRKSVLQHQAGLVYERRLDATHALRLSVHGGQRRTEQFLAIPVGAQASPTTGGGAIDLARDHAGADLRWAVRTELAGRRLDLATGLAWDGVDERRLGFLNFDGDRLGERGALRRDEDNRATAFDQYLQASWRFSERGSVDAGLRHTRLRFSSRDRYLAPGNGDDSGGARFGATLPSLAVSWRLSEDARLYAAIARGFETPTLAELAYRTDGATGFNGALRPARSLNRELGLKLRREDGSQWRAALFETDTRDEIVVQANAGGRASFGNAGATRRRGLELAWSAPLARELRAQLAMTWLDAVYGEGFVTCAGTPCLVPTLRVPAGNRLPGVARTAVHGVLAWTPPGGWHAGLEARHLGRVYVNDANADAAASHLLVAAHLGRELSLGPWTLRTFVRVGNLFDRRHAGSVIVNEASGRFFEPGPGRSWLAGASASVAF